MYIKIIRLSSLPFTMEEEINKLLKREAKKPYDFQVILESIESRYIYHLMLKFRDDNE